MLIRCWLHWPSSHQWLLHHIIFSSGLRSLVVGCMILVSFFSAGKKLPGHPLLFIQTPLLSMVTTVSTQSLHLFTFFIWKQSAWHNFHRPHNCFCTFFCRKQSAWPSTMYANYHWVQGGFISEADLEATSILTLYWVSYVDQLGSISVCYQIASIKFSMLELTGRVMHHSVQISSCRSRQWRLSAHFSVLLYVCAHWQLH